MDKKESGVHVAKVYRTWMVDVRYYYTGELPNNWNSMKPYEQEAWLKANAVRAGEDFKEYVGIDDGTWEEMEQSVPQ
mgnify:CR=1 FL=1